MSNRLKVKLKMKHCGRQNLHFYLAQTHLHRILIIGRRLLLTVIWRHWTIQTNGLLFVK